MQKNLSFLVTSLTHSPAPCTPQQGLGALGTPAPPGTYLAEPTRLWASPTPSASTHPDTIHPPTSTWSRGP